MFVKAFRFRHGFKTFLSSRWFTMIWIVLSLTLLFLIQIRSPLIGYPSSTSAPIGYSVASAFPVPDIPVVAEGTPAEPTLDPISPELLDQLIHNNLTNEDYYANLKPYLWRGCGELCDFKPEDGAPTPVSWWKFYHKKHNCMNLFQIPFVRMAAVRRPPPRTIPKALLDDFTLNGKIPVRDFYFDQQYLGKTADVPAWNESYVNSWIASYRAGNPHNNYGINTALSLGRHLRQLKIHGHWLVIGSENPWVEVILLAEGADMVTTLEYGSINSTHPKLKTILPKDFDEQFMKGTLTKFDGAVSFSSLEHAGLGRYGDYLNPYADVIAISKVWCALKMEAIFLLALESYQGHDALFWNAHRLYQMRYGLVTPNFKLHRQVDSHLFELQKVPAKV